MTKAGSLSQRSSWSIAALLVAPLLGCAAEVDEGDDHEHPIDMVAGQNAAGTMQGLAQGGRWQPPADVLAAGDQQTVTYNTAPAWDGGTNCSGGATDGALTLRDHLLGYFPQVSSIGVYNCRVIDGTNSMSLHGVGRALDVMIPTVGGDADNDLGDPIAAWLIENAAAIGVQTIIWDHSIWRVTYDPRIHEYTGANPHVDHLHVELNIAAGNENQPWFDAPFGPQACAALAAGESVLDNGDDCLRLYGPGQYWRDENAGFSGDLLWTNAFESATPSNWAEWSLPLTVPGSYELAVHIDPTFGVHASARYEIKAGSQTHVVTIDQSTASGWTVLGVFTFNGEAGERVAVFDNTAGPVAAEQHIVVDALRVRPPPAAPPSEEPPSEEPPSEEPAAPESPPDDAAPTDQEPVDGDDPGEADAPLRLSPTAQNAGCAAAPTTPSLALLVIGICAITRRRARR